jgi:cellulose synthase/poly-beta-1,6-N-acetylglucosamine synthase-like glycosyltransferase
MILELLIILGIIGVLGECYIISLWLIAYRRTKKRIFPAYFPFASVIVPCKGTGHGFLENIQGFLAQEYPRYDLIFVVDSTQDPAYTTLLHLIENKPHIHLVLTEPVSGCSGKVAALLTGLENIVTPLQDATIGASTGYRWYFSSNLKTLLISAWNMASIVFMFYPSYTFAWGGSMAIRKNVFDALNIEGKWKTAFSDDLVLTISVKKAGYKIYLQPKCIMESPPETSITSFVRWGTRQYTWVRWYYPVFWIGSFVGFIGAQVIIALGLLLLILGYYIPGLLLSSMILFEILYGWLGISILSKTMTYPKERYPSKIGYALLTPIVFLLLAQNAFASAITQEIHWAGRTYRKPKN